MKQFFSINDVPNLEKIINEAKAIKANPHAHEHLGKHKTWV